MLLGDIISIEGFYETKKVNKYFELIFPRGAFEGCENLTFFIIPKSVKNISRYAFSECKNLKSCNFKGKTFTLKKK